MNPETIIPLVFKLSALLMIFAVGLGASIQDATYLFRKPRELARAFLAVNIVMPLVVVVLILLFDFHPAVKIALAALALAPIPPVMPPKLMKAGGTQSYAYGVVIALGLLAVIFVPVAMEMIELAFKVPLQISPSRVALVIFISILLPIGLGMTIRSLAPGAAEKLAQLISKIAGITLLVSLLGLVFLVRADIWALVGGGIFFSLFVFVVIGIAVGHFFGGPGTENRAALALSTGARHPGIALAIAQVNYPDEPLVLAVVILFMPLSSIVAIPYLIWTKGRQQEVAVQDAVE